MIGSGPNGLAAAVTMAREGARVLVVEAADEVGGGMRSGELTLPGYLHDICAAAHPMGVLSPVFTQFPLEEHGLRWLHGTASVAHPLDDGPAVILRKDLDATCASLGIDAKRYRRLVTPFIGREVELLGDVLGPLRWPGSPLLFARFGWRAFLPATWAAKLRFRDQRARALLAGCAAHSVLPLNKWFTSAMGMVFLVAAHGHEWPVAEGGSRAIASALTSYLESLGGEVRTGTRVTSLAQLPPTKVVLFDTGPDQLASIAATALPARYRRRLGKFRWGPGIFKLDWALDGPIPWRDPACLEASTVHVGGTIEDVAASEAAMWRGEHSDRPFLLVVQQSQFDASRAPEGKHTGYAYCHVPAGSTVDMTEAIENQMERFAPGFRDLVLARSAWNAADFERHNPNYVGGAITGGAVDITQLFTRPVARWNPYTTPNERLYICSASTPPGGGVHGMCGYHAAQAALRRLPKLAVAAF